MASLLTKRILNKTGGSVYESCIRSVMLYRAKTWAMTQREVNIANKYVR